MTVFRHTLQQGRGTLFGWMAVLVFYAALLVAVYPTMAKIKVLADLTKSMPAFAHAILGEEVKAVTTFEGFLSVQFFSMFGLVMAFFAATYVGSLIATEADKKTIDFLLAQPLSRVSVVLQKFAVFLVYLIALEGSTFLALTITAAVVRVETNEWALFLTIVANGLVTLVFGALFLLVSVIVDDRQQAMVFSSAIVFLLYLVDVVGALSKKAEHLALLSPFHYVDSSVVIGRATLASTPTWGLLAVAAGLVAVAVLYFERKDLAA